MTRWADMTREERLDAIREGRKKGLTQQAIAQRYGLSSRNIIIGLANRNGISFARDGRHGGERDIVRAKQGEMARAANRPAREIDWSGKDDRLRKMFAGGASYDAICAALGVKFEALRYHLGVLGLKRSQAERAPARKPRTFDRFFGPQAKEPGLPALTLEPLPPENSAGTVRFLDRESGQCAWPCWPHDTDLRHTPVEALMCCGAEVPAADGPGRRYCPHHRMVASGGRPDGRKLFPERRAA